MDTTAFLDFLKNDPEYKNQIVYTQYIPARDARPGWLDRPLNPVFQEQLDKLDITTLYSHQADAINAVRGGKNVMVATPSASGKTLCYNIPVLEAMLENTSTRALYIFPTKALAQDQLRSLTELAGKTINLPWECATYDGDTLSEDRAGIRRRARIVLTNPDMVHVGILPNHKAWSTFLRRLKYVVVDEAHVYRGVFGSHVANILRRLRRICDVYGSKPQFILCSATIANPGEHAERISGLPFQVIEADGAPYGGKAFVFWNPPVIDEARSVRRSANSEATYLFTELIRRNIRTLTFAPTRKLTELIYVYSRDQLGHPLGDRIMSYRAGYLAADRRNIERQLFNGELLGAVATNALELGIDIGDLDATVITGYPGSIASTWQQAGRSGRRGEKSLSFLVAQNNPLDQYFMNNPDFFFGKAFENALINWENSNILNPHLLCAAWEKPLDEADARYFGDALLNAVAELEAEGRLRQVGKRWHIAPQLSHPAHDVNIRSASGHDYQILDASRGYELLETVEEDRAFWQVHPGAIYLHQGDSYFVKELDLEKHIAVVEPAAVPYYTQTMELTDLKVLQRIAEKQINGVRVCLGVVDVSNQVDGYRKKKHFTDEVLGEELLDLPPQRFITQAVWFDLPQPAVNMVERGKLDFHGGLHAAEHAAIAILPLFAMCDRNDIGGVSTPLHADTGKAQIFIYDGYPGGIGIAEKGYQIIEELWAATLKAIEECPCRDGCPACIQSPKCGNNNEPLDKKAAVILLRGLIG
ncbi:MAG: DEAD/DEAH box helicase [Dehalococcoidia bacterium]|nr:DEAD/DEAH box helicase [Dehalococcoidia bacterium]MDD5495322.1 DEAD/DEAH box helicase [Dehalococcoidia bacterium]